MAKKPDCKKECIATRKTFKRSVPCGDDTGNIDKCPYVEFLRNKNVKIWRLWNDMAGDLSIQQCEKVFGWYRVPNEKRDEVREKLFLIKSEFDKVEENRTKNAKFEKQLGNYQNSVRGRK